MKKKIHKIIIKKAILMLILVLTLVLGSITALAGTNSQDSDYTCQINDDANLLTSAEKQQLLKEMQNLSEYGNIVFQSVKLPEGRDYEQYARDSYFDLFEKQPGVLFQIDMGNRKLTLFASTGMEKLLGHERDSIVDNVYRTASGEDYFGCAFQCFEQIQSVLNHQGIAHTMKYISNGILALILGLFLNLLVIFATIMHRKKTPLNRQSVCASPTISNVRRQSRRISRTYTPHSGSEHSGGGGSGGSSGGGGGGASGGSSSHGF